MSSDALKYYSSIAPTIAEFTKPLKDYLSISCFVYVKVYKNSKYIFISSDLKITQDYIFNAHNSNVFYRDYLSAESLYHPILWPIFPKNPSMEIYFNHGYWHGLSLVNKQEDYFEGICFLSDKDNYKINDLYINNVKILEKYADHFKSTFGDNIIVKGDKNLVTYDQGFDFSWPIKEAENDRYKIREFLRASGIEHGSVSINKKVINITSRELQCLGLLSKGLSMKGIVRELLLSPRTVESHINNIKDKTGYSYKYDLIQLYQSKLI